MRVTTMGLVITAGIGQCALSCDPDALLATHALGSCVAVAIHDGTARVAGLLHAMLPDSARYPAKAGTQPYLFADTGIPALLRSAYALGASRDRLTVRLVGGARMLDAGAVISSRVFNIGARNLLACRKALRAEGLAVHGEATGGSVSRSVRLEVASGKLLWSAAGGAWRSLEAERAA